MYIYCCYLMDKYNYSNYVTYNYKKSRDFNNYIHDK